MKNNVHKSQRLVHGNGDKEILAMKGEGRGVRDGMRKEGGVRTCERPFEQINELSYEDIHPELEGDERVQQDLKTATELLAARLLVRWGRFVYRVRLKVCVRGEAIGISGTAVRT